MAVGGPLGDLLESTFKRGTRVTDAGRWQSGSGGLESYRRVTCRLVAVRSVSAWPPRNWPARIRARSNRVVGARCGRRRVLQRPCRARVRRLPRESNRARVR
ncbi:phosphatidate cytidylyltransferase [Streptomyces chartreusis]